MFSINRLNVLTTICMLSGLLFVDASTAITVQWPVNAGPVHQAVPQYRARYPLSGSAAPNPTPQSGLKFKRVEPIVDSITGNPNELPRPESIQPSQLPAPQPAAKRPSLPSKPLETVEQSTPSRVNRYPLGGSTSVDSAPAKPQPKPRSVSKDKSATAKKDIAKKAKAKTKKHAPPAISYDIYRDTNPFPIDPRKPNGICTTANRSCGCGQNCGQTRGCESGCVCRQGCDAPGLHGKPYQEREPGGCRCGDKKCGKCASMFSLYWPRPFSAKLEESCAGKSCQGCRQCQENRIVDVFDKFADFKLIDYHRTDNGYCGEDSDPYGCLGESRMFASRVVGVGYRFPSVPVDRSASTGAAWR